MSEVKGLVRGQGGRGAGVRWQGLGARSPRSNIICPVGAVEALAKFLLDAWRRREFSPPLKAGKVTQSVASRSDG